MDCRWSIRGLAHSVRERSASTSSGLLSHLVYLVGDERDGMDTGILAAGRPYVAAVEEECEVAAPLPRSTTVACYLSQGIPTIWPRRS